MHNCENIKWKRPVFVLIEILCWAKRELHLVALVCRDEKLVTQQSMDVLKYNGYRTHSCKKVKTLILLEGDFYVFTKLNLQYFINDICNWTSIDVGVTVIFCSLKSYLIYHSEGSTGHSIHTWNVFVENRERKDTICTFRSVVVVVNIVEASKFAEYYKTSLYYRHISRCRSVGHIHTT